MRNKGVVAVLAMIFVALFGVLAVAVMAMTTNAIDITRNDRNGQAAMAAAESGMAYLQRLVGDITISGGQTGQQVIQTIQSNLVAAGAGAFGGQSPVFFNGGTTANTTITIPWLTPHAGSTCQFTATISLSPFDVDSVLAPLTLSVTGKHNPTNLKRSLQIVLRPADRLADIFTYGVYARGRVDLADGKADIIGNPLGAGSLGSAYSGGYAIFVNGGNVTGNIYVNGDPATTFQMGRGGGTIGVLQDNGDPQSVEDAMKHVLGHTPPTFPDFNPNQFDLTQLGKVKTRTNQPDNPIGGKLFQDCEITVDMTFSGTDTLQGLVFIKKGVTVTFQGNPTINAVLVVEDPGNGNTSTSTLNFQGAPTFGTVIWGNGSKVPTATREALDGYSILGPTAYIYMQGNSGGSGSNATFAGSIVCGTLEEYGSGMVRIHNGALISMADTMATGARSYASLLDGDGVLIDRDSNYHPPLGGYVHQYSWVVDPLTYTEKVPQ